MKNEELNNLNIIYLVLSFDKSNDVWAMNQIAEAPTKCTQPYYISTLGESHQIKSMVEKAKKGGNYKAIKAKDNIPDLKKCY